MMLDSVTDVVPLVDEARKRGSGLVIATVVSNVSDSAISVGTRLAVKDNSESVGAFEPNLDRLVIEDALEALRRRTSVFQSYSFSGHELQRTRPGSGQIDVFFHVLARPSRLIIVGAGHIALPLSRMASVLDMHVTVVDDRPEFATAERFPDAENVVVGPYAQTLEQLNVDTDTFVVLVTRGHVHDQSSLEILIGSSARYIGMIGSKRRVRTVIHQLKARGYDAARLDAVHAPVGLAIGAETPAEIAIAILAEIVAVVRNVQSVRWTARGRASDR